MYLEKYASEGTQKHTTYIQLAVTAKHIVTWTMCKTLPWKFWSFADGMLNYQASQ